MDYESSLNTSNDIRISHEINEAIFNLSAMSLDLICVILAQIEKYDTEYKFYKLNISTIEKRINRKLNRDSFKKSVKELESATLDISSESIKWFEIFNFESSNGILEVKLNEQLKPYLLNLESNFVLAKLDSILNSHYFSLEFQKKISLNLIELCKFVNTFVGILVLSIFWEKIKSITLEALPFCAISIKELKIFSFAFLLWCVEIVPISSIKQILYLPS